MLASSAACLYRAARLHRSFYGLLAILFGVAAACGSTNSTIAFREEALRGDADALVYLFRESAMLGGAVSWNVYLDGQVVELASD